MRRRAALLVGLTTLALAGAAGAVSNRHPRDPREAFTAADRAWAQRIVLTRSDLAGGGWRSTAPSAGEDPRCSSFDPDQSDLTLSGEADSRDFERGELLVASSAQVFRTAAQTRTSFRRTAKGRQLIRCYDELFRRAAGSEGETRLASGRVVAAPRVGERRLAVRLIWAVTVEEVTLRVYMDVIGWDRGRASAGLVVFSVGAQPDRTLEARLARRIDSRMHAP